MATCAELAAEINSYQQIIVQGNNLSAAANAAKSAINFEADIQTAKAKVAEAQSGLGRLQNAVEKLFELGSQAVIDGCPQQNSFAITLASQGDALALNIRNNVAEANRAIAQREQANKAEEAAKKQDNAGNGTPGSAGATGAAPTAGATGPATPQGTVSGASGATGVLPSSKQTPEGQLDVAEPTLVQPGEINVNPSSSIQQGLEQQAREQATMMDATKYAQAADWRVRLSLADNANYLYKASPVGPLLAPLQATNGIIFPYTPSISVSYVANYDQSLLQHSNYKVVQYQNSAVESVTIGCDFTAQSVQEANYVLATIHFLRSVTKMFYGQDEEPIRGTPPPLCYLTGLGQYNFSAHPLVITGFTYTLPTDVDYIRAVPQDPPPKDNSQVLSSLRIGQGNQSGAAAGGLPNPPNFTPGSEPPTMVPTRINIQIQATPVVARNTISNQFSLKEYATGALLAGRKITGGGIW